MRTAVVAVFGLVVIGATLACGGAMSQAASETLAESKASVNACTGDGQPAMLAAIDAGVTAAESDVYSFTELVELQMAVDSATADGDVTTAEAESFAELIVSLASN